MNVKLGQT